MNDAMLFSSEKIPFTNTKFFTIYNNAIPEEILTIFKPESKSLTKIVDYAKSWGDQLFTKFDESEEPPTDPLRRGIPLKGRLHKNIATIKAALEEVCFRYVKNHCENEDFISLKDGTLFVSLPGIEQQDKHADYDLDHPNAAKSLIVCVYLSDNGKFIFYNNNLEYIVNCAKGDVVICRGDVQHAGASYSELNIRAHFYVDYISTEFSKEDIFGQPARGLNETYFFSEDGFKHSWAQHKRKWNAKKAGKEQACTRKKNMVKGLSLTETRLSKRQRLVESKNPSPSITVGLEPDVDSSTSNY